MTPATLRYSKALFELLLEHAKPEKAQMPQSDEIVECLVFRGTISNLYEQVGASKSYYGPVRKVLMDSGSIITLERGSIHSPSVVVVDPAKPPPDSLPLNVNSAPDRLTIAREVDTLRGEVSQLANSLGGLNIKDALVNFEQRISRLENEMGETEREQVSR